MKTELDFLGELMICGLVLGLGTTRSPAAAGAFSDANWISLGGIPGANGTVYAATVDGSGNLYFERLLEALHAAKLFGRHPDFPRE